MNKNYNAVSKMIMDLNNFITKDSEAHEYHMKHIELVKSYALLINKKLGCPVSNKKLSYIALSHDLFKERSLNPSKDGTITWKGHNIPQDTTAYVRLNLDVLEPYQLDEYFNTDVQYHALSAGLFLIKEFKLSDPEILYPVMFHSCPIIPIYETLSPKIQIMVDIITLSDKLSSNYLKINLIKKEVRIDLDLAVFGKDGNEFNYTLGLLLARLIAQGKSEEEQSKISTNYYYQRLAETNPLIKKDINIKKIGDNKLWPERKSQALKIR